MLRRNQLRRSFATTAGATIAFTAVSALTGVIATRALGPHERGLLATAVVWSAVLGSLAAVGVPQAATYFVARESRDPAAFASAALLVAGAAGGLLALVGTVTTWLLVDGDAVLPLVILFAASPPLLAGGAATGAVLGTGDYLAWGVIRFLYPFLSLIGVLGALSAGWATATAVAGIMACATVVQTILSAVTLYHLRLLGRPSMASVKQVCSFGWRNIVSGAAWLLSYQLDQLYLSIAVVPSLLGMYAVAASFVAVIVPVAASAGSIMLARVSAGGTREVRTSLRPVLALSAVSATSAAVVVSIAAPSLITLLFGEAFTDAVPSVRILMVGAVAASVSTVLSDTIKGLGRPLAPARAELVGAVITVGLLFSLVPALGIAGAALASSISYSVVAALLAVVLRIEMAHQEGRVCG